MTTKEWRVYNTAGKERIVVTKRLEGDRWIDSLTSSGYRVEVCLSDDTLTGPELVEAMGNSCVGVIGQMAEQWDSDLLQWFKSAGGKVYCNYAVGYNNVDIAAATSLGICIGNTPGVLTGATAELAVALTFAAARRIVEGDDFVRKGKFTGWKSWLLLGNILERKTLGVVGAGRIGSAYARMMVEGHRMNLRYFNRGVNKSLEDSLAAFNKYVTGLGEEPVQAGRSSSIEELLQVSDVVSLHVPLNPGTRHLIDGPRLRLMKKDAILINVSRGPVVDEQALVEHCRKNPEFRAGLDVYEDEPVVNPVLRELANVILLPHIGSATSWTREAMSTIAARNVSSVLSGYLPWKGKDVLEFLMENPPKAAPSIVNAAELGL